MAVHWPLRRCPEQLARFVGGCSDCCAVARETLRVGRRGLTTRRSRDKLDEAFALGIPFVTVGPGKSDASVGQGVPVVTVGPGMSDASVGSGMSDASLGPGMSARTNGAFLLVWIRTSVPTRKAVRDQFPQRYGSSHRS